MPLANVRTKWVDGKLEFTENDGTIIVTFNPETRAIEIPSGAALTVAGVTVDATTLSGSGTGLGILRMAKATFNPSATAGQRTVAPHGLGVTLPDNALVVGGFIEILTTFADGASDNATIALSVEGANDIVSAIAISDVSNVWDAGKQAIIPKANTPELTAIKLSAAREITATVAVHALTAGKATIFLYYVEGD